MCTASDLYVLLLTRVFCFLAGKSPTPLEAARTETSRIEIDRQQLYDIINCNCIGEEFQDIGACALRAEEPSGHIGLWPEPALINHSCAPNATHFVIGDRLMVRATEEIPQGGGDSELDWCKAESKFSGTELEGMMVEASEFCKELGPFLDESIEEEDLKEVQDIRTDLEDRKESIEKAMREAKVSSKLRKWLQVSIYDIYDLISLCADEGAELQSQLDAKQRNGGGRGGRGGRGGGGRGGGSQGRGGIQDLHLDTEALAVCTRLVECVAKGSDAHLYLSAELMVRTAGKFGNKHEESKQATRMCHEAFKAHYGPISESLLDELAEARLNVAE
eukprot:gene21169-28065_t